MLRPATALASDALTGMLMKADGVTEVDLDALLRRVAKAHEKEALLKVWQLTYARLSR